MMSKRLKPLLLAGLLLAPMPLAAQATGPSPATATLDPEAAAALDRMGAHLRTLTRFQVRADASVERVFEGNRKIASDLHTTYTVEQPDRMMVDIQAGDSHKRVFYDGQTMTVVGVKIGRYTSFPVSGPLTDVLATARDRFGLDFPLQDLFRWGSPSAVATVPSEGFRVGKAEVDGKPAGHYFFRQEGVDFQLWIAEGAEPLPLRMIITNTENPAQPAYDARFRWNVAPQISATSFTFQPGPNDRAIDLGAMKASASR
jgi:hypothetical protein